MTIEITGAPTAVSSPGFAGDAVRIPLSEEPTAAWLDHLRRQPLPGKAHRLDGAALEFYLDRDSRDVVGAMKRIADAIAATNTSSAAAAEDDAKAEERLREATDGRREKINRLLEEWWTKRQEKAAASDG